MGQAAIAGCLGAGTATVGFGGVIGMGRAKRVPHQEQTAAPGATQPRHDGQAYH